MICNMIRSGYNYERIAQFLEMSEDSVKQRVKAMRDKGANQMRGSREKSK